MYDKNPEVAQAMSIGNRNANSTQLSGAATSTRPPDGPISVVLTQRLFACLNELQGLNSRLSAAADRMVGPYPQAEGKDDRAPPAHLSDRMDYGVDAFSSLLNDLRQEIERVERFV